MANVMRIKYGELGNRSEMPKLQFEKDKGCELGYRTDEKALYIGTANGNVRLCGADDIEELCQAINNINARLDALSKG